MSVCVGIRQVLKAREMCVILLASIASVSDPVESMTVHSITSMCIELYQCICAVRLNRGIRHLHTVGFSATHGQLSFYHKLKTSTLCIFSVADIVYYK